VRIRATGKAIETGKEEATFVCRKEDGAWKIDMQASDMFWNSSGPRRGPVMKSAGPELEGAMEGAMPDPEAMRKAMEALKKGMEEAGNR
jgi:hypothetical protein